MMSSEKPKRFPAFRRTLREHQTVTVVEYAADGQIAYAQINDNIDDIASWLINYVNKPSVIQRFTSLFSPPVAVPTRVEFHRVGQPPDRSQPSPHQLSDRTLMPPRQAPPDVSPHDGDDLMSPPHSQGETPFPVQPLSPDETTSTSVPQTAAWLKVNLYGPQDGDSHKTMELRPQLGVAVSALVNQLMSQLDGHDVIVVIIQSRKFRRYRGSEKKFGLKWRPVEPNTSGLEIGQVRHAWFRYYFLCHDAVYPGKPIHFTHKDMAPHVFYTEQACRNAYRAWRQGEDLVQLVKEFNLKGR